MIGANTDEWRSVRVVSVVRGLRQLTLYDMTAKNGALKLDPPKKVATQRKRKKGLYVRLSDAEKEIVRGLAAKANKSESEYARIVFRRLSQGWKLVPGVYECKPPEGWLPDPLD